MTSAGSVGGIDVSRETWDRLKAFAALVDRWTGKINLIAPKSRADIWQRHIADSAQLFAFANTSRTTPAHWCDLGSGGGFPGIVLATLAAEKMPDDTFTLIESDQRKATFLRTAIRELGLDATVLATRIETADPQQADRVTARALSPLPALLPLVVRHLSHDGRALLLKGAQASSEIEAARADWTFDLTERSSMTDPDARLLCIERIARD